ncbi:MAG: hypothetical protein U9O94_04490 [Nanoarchaeota archaeon]|nr:hypothetical protein [Nanoarchaeota archaeon]
MNGDHVDQIVEKLGIEKTFWIKQLRELNPRQVGIVKVSGNLLENNELAAEMAYLAGEGFYLPVVLGGGKAYDEIVGQGKDFGKVHFNESDGKGGFKEQFLRVTPENLIEDMVALAKENLDNVVRMIKSKGVDVVAIPLENMVVEPYNDVICLNGQSVNMGRTAAPSMIDPKPFHDAIDNGMIPVMSHVGVFNGQYYNTNATSAAFELAGKDALDVFKVMLVGDTPVMKEGKRVERIASIEDYNELTGVLIGGMGVNVGESISWLQPMGPGRSVQLTKLKTGTQENIESTGLLEELLGFSNNSGGTMITLPPDYTPRYLNQIPTGERGKIRKLIDHAFEIRGLKLSGDYFNNLEPDKTVVYMDEQQKAIAITYDICGINYMCKLGTDPGYRGLRLGEFLISKAFEDSDNGLVWRSSKDKEGLNRFYKSVLDYYKGKGHSVFAETKGEYHVYGIDVESGKKDKVIGMIEKIKPTFMEV